MTRAVRPQRLPMAKTWLNPGLRSAFFSVDILKLEMPALSPTMAEGTIAQWVKKEGDRVEVGDVVCEITTDKATIGYES